MTFAPPQFETRLARSAEELAAAQHLRYRVFVQELGGTGAMVDHAAQLERDRFDPFFDHLLLLDHARPGALRDQVVGVYRLLTDDRAREMGQFYSADEYDLGVLTASGRKLLELGRSCLHPDYRGGEAMFQLWNALSEYIADRGIEVLFGVASFHGTDTAALAPSLSLLHARHLAPDDLRVRAQPSSYLAMDQIAESDLDRVAAMKAVPPLIKGYLKLGGFVGEGAFVDHAFNTVDICLVLDMARLNEKQSRLYTRSQGGGQ
ncbi:GNAT family N-acetyltransferase [Pseudooceanicola sediminis]|uniref:L-ornithine N(alpha)-acyltransferase n=1 Tax=Pseudooceanicola sediminis TaxID=2211117 RepID=A0A399J8R0_9RHOB|nr:GNAT family N-acyltransferase [Pseudooceanicola sediminis]KAA2316960.1 GNAT family N-acetyltransferase [Puniceibacterium sp. HSS470]RII40589.1 GNAT family N-acetyltransferase [Pseudooceanicola sediminis]|tara:strand:- start:30825 stop:31610 length:786 start_codon:yes stop_codon:yes gene_type:complete